MLLNQSRAIMYMKKNGMDALIATHPNHVTYASNYGGHSPRIYLDRMVFSVLPCRSESGHSCANRGCFLPGPEPCVHLGARNLDLWNVENHLAGRSQTGC